MNSKKLECFDDDDSVDDKPSLSFLGKWKINEENSIFYVYRNSFIDNVDIYEVDYWYEYHENCVSVIKCGVRNAISNCRIWWTLTAEIMTSYYL